MKVVDRFDVSKPPQGPKKYSFELTGHGLVSLLVLGVFGIAWIFFLGVLLGRGNKPENAVPQLAKIMPTPSAADQGSATPPTVLKPEELQFQDTLQGRTPPETAVANATPKTGGAQTPQNPAQQGPAPRVAQTPRGQVATAKAEPDKKVAKPQPEKKSAAPGAQNSRKNSGNSGNAPASKKPVETRTYQVAALDTEVLARAEAEKMRKKGLVSTVEKAGIGGKSVYRVLIRVKGTPAEIKQALEKSGTKKPILRDKKSL